MGLRKNRLVVSDLKSDRKAEIESAGKGREGKGRTKLKACEG